MACTLQQVAKWNSKRNPLENVLGGGSIAPTIIARGQEDNAQMILYCEDFESTKNIRWLFMKKPCEITTDGSSPKHNNRVVEPKGYEYAGVAVHPASKKLEFDGYKDKECPTLLATDWKCPKTILEERADEPLVYDGFNQQVRQDNSTIGTITRNVGADLKRNGQGIIEPVIIEDFYKGRGNRYYDQEAPTIRADRDGLKVAEPKQADFRVRKLTERECFRLQGVKDTDFAKIRQNQSKSSCYHLAGDSITTSVLMALFGQMLGLDWRSKVDELVEEIKK